MSTILHNWAGEYWTNGFTQWKSWKLMRDLRSAQSSTSRAIPDLSLAAAADGMIKPTFFKTQPEFRLWLQTNHETAPELLVGFWKKSTGKPSIDWPQARDQALCFGWIDGHRKSLGEDAYTIRFTPRRKGSIWSKVNVERFEALKGAGLMTAAGEAAYERDKHRSGIYSYEKPVAELTAAEERLFRKHKQAWADWEKRPAGYRRSALGWVTGAKKPETRAKRLAELIGVSAEGRRLPQYDWQKKP